MSETTLEIEERADRSVVTLHRPGGPQRDQRGDDRRAARRLRRAWRTTPRLLLLTGDGGAFAGGADIGELRERGRDEALRGHQQPAVRPDRPAAAADGRRGRRVRARRRRRAGLRLRHPAGLAGRGVRQPRARAGHPRRGRRLLAAAASWSARRWPSRCCWPGGGWTPRTRSGSGWSPRWCPPASCSSARTRLLDRMARSAPLALRLTKLVADAPGGAPDGRRPGPGDPVRVRGQAGPDGRLPGRRRRS